MRTPAALLRGGGELHIVENDAVTSVPDPDGAIHRLVSLADGTRSSAELFSALALDYPNIDEQDVQDAIDRLQTAGIFDDPWPGRVSFSAVF